MSCHFTKEVSKSYIFVTTNEALVQDLEGSYLKLLCDVEQCFQQCSSMLVTRFRTVLDLTNDITIIRKTLTETRYKYSTNLPDSLFVSFPYCFMFNLIFPSLWRIRDGDRDMSLETIEHVNLSFPHMASRTCSSVCKIVTKLISARHYFRWHRQ